LNGSHIILDNSAHEQTHGGAPELLLEQAEGIGAYEVVCPDHLFDSSDTVYRTREALHYFLKQEIRLHQMSQVPRWMIVPQGNSFDDYSMCLQDLILEFLTVQRMSVIETTFLPTIGVSKDYETWEGGLLRVLEETVFPLTDHIPNVQIHLLGWGRDLWALREIMSLHGEKIRSVDSAKPFVYGINGIQLNPLKKRVPEYPRRSLDYFTADIPADKMSIVRENIRVFDEIVSGGTINDSGLRSV